MNPLFLKSSRLPRFCEWRHFSFTVDSANYIALDGKAALFSDGNIDSYSFIEVDDGEGD